MKALTLVIWLALVAPDPSLEQHGVPHAGHVWLDPWASFEVSFEALIAPWEPTRAAQLSLESLAFPKVDTDELKPFFEPSPLLFDKVDAGELKPFPYDS